MPKEIIIDGLTIDDSNHPKDYQGIFLFSDPDGKPAATRPFAYHPTEQVTIRGLTIASGLKPRASPDADFAKGVKIVEAN